MFTMTIPLSSLADEHYALLGRLAILYHATLMADATHATVEFRTLRFNGGDIGGLDLASSARELLQALVPIADACDPIPEPTSV